jgi:hypothetical protein
MTEIQNRLKSGVLVIENWNLDIVCNLLFDAWNFINSMMQYFTLPQKLSLALIHAH